MTRPGLGADPQGRGRAQPGGRGHQGTVASGRVGAGIPGATARAPLPDPGQSGAGAGAQACRGHGTRAGRGEAATFRATCRPRASCRVARDVLFLAGPERALCGGRAPGIGGGGWARRPRGHQLRRPARRGRPPIHEAGGSTGEVSPSAAGPALPPSLAVGALAFSREALSQADPGGPAPWEGGGDPSSPRAGRGAVTSPVWPGGPLGAVIGRATRRVLLTPRQRGQAGGCGGLAPSISRPPISPFPGLDQEGLK